MAPQNSKRKRSVRITFNRSSDLFQINFGKIILESDNSEQFFLRENELERINVRRLPSGIKYILKDETLQEIPNLINVKIILQKTDTAEFWITFEESSRHSRWENASNMVEYFDVRHNYLNERQKEKFDLIIGSDFTDGQFLFLQYTVTITGIDNNQLLKLCRMTTEAIHKSSINFNN
jgi:hypothetical protein